MFYIKTPETTDECESMTEVEAKVNSLVFQYGEPDVTVTDDRGLPYGMRIELQLPKRIYMNPNFSMV